MNKPRVLLADDHQIVAEGLRSLLETKFELVDVVEDGRTLIQSVQKHRPDVIVIDISMPLLNGIDALHQLKKIDECVLVRDMLQSKKCQKTLFSAVHEAKIVKKTVF